VLELMVVEGADTGRQFTLEGGEVAIGRGDPASGRVGAVLLADATISSRQALVHLGPDGAILEHLPDATNPTLVNGNEIRRKSIQPGDRIRMGRTVFEVREREGMSLSGLTEVMTESRRTQAYLPSLETPATAADRTEVRRVGGAWGRLRVERGPEDLVGRSFELERDKISIGRNPASDVALLEPGVSRNHAEIAREGGDVVLRHLSQTNETYLNGLPVRSREVLRGGEEIQLADRVVMRFELGGAAAAEAPEAERPEPGLMTMMEDKLRRDRAIEEEFGFEGSFLDIDVVDSYGLKAQAQRPEYIILSFERFRAFARGVVEEFEGQLLNSNGDELMCFFESPARAVECAAALLERLEGFNARENLLGLPFRVRQGVHTGHCLVDRRRGVAYSDVLDVAGHLQKHADVNGLLISEPTLRALPDAAAFEPASPLPREALPTHRLKR
jgi:pSer/pThr/pTyr-binding forkhead associated (FHA) protein